MSERFSWLGLAIAGVGFLSLFLYSLPSFDGLRTLETGLPILVFTYFVLTLGGVLLTHGFRDELSARWQWWLLTVFGPTLPVALGFLISSDSRGLSLVFVGALGLLGAFVSVVLGLLDSKF